MTITDPNYREAELAALLWIAGFSLAPVVVGLILVPTCIFIRNVFWLVVFWLNIVKRPSQEGK